MDKNTRYLGQPILQQVLSLIDESTIYKAATKHKAPAKKKSVKTTKPVKKSKAKPVKKKQA